MPVCRETVRLGHLSPDSGNTCPGVPPATAAFAQARPQATVTAATGPALLRHVLVTACHR